jgi:hypothetical protein
LATSQSDIFNKLKAVQSAQTLPKYDSPVSASMNNMDITSFLFEMLKQTVGMEGVKNIVLKSTLGELNNSINISNTIFSILQDVFFCLFDIIIPVSKTTGHDGIIVNVSEIDITHMLSVDPNSPEGRHVYESNDPAKCLNYLIYTAFSVSSEETAVKYMKNGKTLFTMYYLGGNEFMLHIGAEYAGKKLSAWAEDYLQGMNFFNMPNFMAELLDIITGVVSVKTGQSQSALQQSATFLAVMQKLFGFCTSTPNTNGSTVGNAIYNETGTQDQTMEPINVSPNNYLKKQEDKKANSGDLFNFSPSDILNIEDIASLLGQNKVRFTTCGNFEVQIDPNGVFASLDALFADSIKTGTVSYPNPDNPLETLTAPKYNNSDIVPDIDNSVTVLNSVLTDNIPQYVNNASGNPQGSPNANDVMVSLPNIQVDFNLSIIKAIPYAIAQLVISPQLLLFIKVASNIIGAQVNAGVFTLESIVNQIEKIIVRIGTDIWNMILNNVLNILTRELTGILASVITRYLTQRFTDYINILAFIANLLKQLPLPPTGCQGILDMIMQLLGLGGLGAAFPIPPPLVYAGGMLKPGLNQVSVVNDLKSQLVGKGIEVGSFMPDGSPNYLMAALEIHTNNLIQHIKMDSRIDVMTIGTGVGTGYGQIS